MKKILVGNCPIGGDKEKYLFEQECDCNHFPCKHYTQNKTGKWFKKEK